MAALVQDDDKLTLPMINNVGNEVWKTKEAKLTSKEAPDLGDAKTRGVLMETIAAVDFLLAGSDILILRHPESVKLVKGFIQKIAQKRAAAAERVQVDRERAKPVAAAKPAPKPVAKPAVAAAPKAAPATKPKPKAEAKPEPVKVPEPAVEAAAALDPEAEAKAKAEVEAKTKAEGEAKAKAEAEVREKAEAEAKAKEEAEAKAKSEEERRARDEAKEKASEDLAGLRRKRREEKEKRVAESTKKKKGKKGVEYGEGPKQGMAGADAIYIIRSIERWRLRGDGILKK